MRNTILTTVTIILSLSKVSFSQNPTFELRATNFTPLNQVTNAIEFDITLKWTNPGVAPNFEYAGGQYFFNFNAGISNGGTLTYRYALDTSDLPPNMRPRSPVAYTSSTPAQLRLAVNTFPGPGNGFQMPPNTPVKIIRMRLSTTAASFNQIENFGIQWRIAPPNPYTKIFAYIGTTNTDISVPSQPYYVDFPTYPMTSISIKLGLEGLYKNGKHQLRDSATIFLRSSISPFQIVDTAKVVLDSMSLTANFVTSVPEGTYYFVVRHRNSLESWSKAGGELIAGGNLTYDFTTSASQAYGNNLTLVGDKYCIYSGNINGDDIIDAEDLIYVDNDVFNYAPGTNITNLNGDQIVDIEDLAICEKNARALRIVQWPGAASILHSTLSGESNIRLKPEQFVKP
jgi:hypothetical protein